MAAFVLTQAARADLKAIAVFTQRRWGREQRRLYIRQFDDAFHLLAERPEAGTVCDSIKSGYRKFPNGGHVVFYRQLSDSEIEVVRILHKRMDLVRQLEYT
ncbi:MAG: plasmid stabilization protein ParE [Haliea sp.]|nr:plasmid stabilization protein ParE [Haliea sp.]|tara:strand:+ start:92816 stop:93118 length:303 start_codon:yes stop_codon:yes gene_type:complete